MEADRPSSSVETPPHPCLRKSLIQFAEDIQKDLSLCVEKLIYKLMHFLSPLSHFGQFMDST